MLRFAYQAGCAQSACDCAHEPRTRFSLSIGAILSEFPFGRMMFLFWRKYREPCQQVSFQSHGKSTGGVLLTWICHGNPLLQPSCLCSLGSCHWFGRYVGMSFFRALLAWFYRETKRKPTRPFLRRTYVCEAPISCAPGCSAATLRDRGKRLKSFQAKKVSQHQCSKHRCPFWLVCLTNRGPWFRWGIYQGHLFFQKPPSLHFPVWNLQKRRDRFNGNHRTVRKPSLGGGWWSTV